MFTTIDGKWGRCYYIQNSSLCYDIITICPLGVQDENAGSRELAAEWSRY